MTLYKEIENKVEVMIKQFDSIDKTRLELLKEFSLYISEKLSNNAEVKLNFICTHNSRRSHMSQIWAQTAAYYFGIENVKCYSGGTEATAFNPRAVKAVSDFGLRIEKSDESENPVYKVYFSDSGNPLECFSKVYSDAFNPQKNFAAIMTCSDADEKCPIVHGADQRFPIRYNDPKEFDDTELEAKMYSKRSEQIGIEMLFVFSIVKK